MIDVLLSIRKEEGILLPDQSTLDSVTFESNKTYKLQRGQQYLFNKQINVPITLSSYGSGAMPVALGSADASQLPWVDESGGLYSIVIPEPNWVWIHGFCGKKSETDWITVTGVPASNQVSINPADISGYTSIVGAKFVAIDRTFSYSLEFTVTNYSSGTLTLDGDLDFINSGDEFKLFGLQEFISGNDEWAYESGTLYVQLSQSPSVTDIRISNSDYGLEINADGCIIENIDFQQYYSHGIKNQANSTIIRNCRFADIRDSALFSPNQKTGVQIKSNYLTRIGNNGIQIGAHNNLVIEDNDIIGVGNQANIGWQTYDVDLNGNTVSLGEGFGIRIQIDPSDDTLSGDNITIKNNRISNNAYNSIGVAVGGSSVLIEENVCKNFCELLEDGAGIYLFRYRPQNAGISAEIRRNIVYNTEFKHSIVIGCYLDNRSYQCHVHDNVFYDSFGLAEILVNGDTREHTIEDNICISNNGEAILFNDFDVTPIFTEGANINRRNVFAVKKSTLYCHDNDLGTGIFTENNYNYYFSPYSANVARRAGTPLTFAQLQSEYSDDANSIAKVNWLTYVDESTALEHVKLYTNETDSDIQVTIPSGYEDIDGNDISGQQKTIPSRFNGCPGLIVLRTED